MTGPPKLLFVSDLNPHSNGHARLQGFAALGCTVRGLSLVPIGGADGGAAKPSLAERIAWKLGYPLDTARVQYALIEAVAGWRPDLVWIDKGNVIRPEILARVRSSVPNAILVSFSPDDMFARHNRSRYYTAGLKYYDIVFTTKSYNADPGELPALGARRVVFVDNWFNPNHRPVPLTDAERRRWGGDVGFIGTFERARFHSMLYLARHGVPVRVWGNGWHHTRSAHANLRIEGRPLPDTDAELLYTKGLCSTRINLGFLRKLNRDRQTERSVAIPACGAFLLAERTEEHRRLFSEGREAEYFASDKELLDKTRYYLTHEDERAAIAAAGRRRCLASGYSLADRLRFMLDQALALRPGG